MIIPVFKAITDDKISVKNYPPISLICNVSKVLKGLIYDKIYPEHISPWLSKKHIPFKS